MRERTTSSVAAVPTFRITSASAGLMPNHCSISFSRGSIHVRMAIFGAGFRANVGSCRSALLRFAATARSIKLICRLLDHFAHRARWEFGRPLIVSHIARALGITPLNDGVTDILSLFDVAAVR